MPEPGNPQALNRYAYVYNNPLRYTDPSGHDPCGGPGVYVPDCGVDGWGMKPPRQPRSPSFASSVPLTTRGAQMLSLCQAYYGGSCNTQDFLARGLTPEFKSIVFRKDDPTASARIELLGHATTHSVYMKCEYENGGRPCAGLTTNAILNWMGGYSQTSYNMYRKWKSGTSLAAAVPQEINPIAQQVAASVFNPPDPEWTRSRGTDNEPASWGNRSLFIEEPEEWLRTNYGEVVLWRYGLEGQDYFYVFTYRQRELLEQIRKTNP